MKYKAKYKCDTCSATTEIIWDSERVGHIPGDFDIPTTHICGFRGCQGTHRIVTDPVKERAARVNEFANKIAHYVEHGQDYSNWGKHRAIVEAITILFNDIGACHDFLNVLGLKIDLYTMSIEELNGYLDKKKEGD